MDHTTRQLCELVASGQSLRYAARETGVSLATAWQRLEAQAPQLERRRRSPLGQVEVAQIRTLSNDGIDSVREISRRVGRSWHACRRVLESASCTRTIGKHRCPSCGYEILTNVCIICRARAS